MSNQLQLDSGSGGVSPSLRNDVSKILGNDQSEPQRGGKKAPGRTCVGSTRPRRLQRSFCDLSLWCLCCTHAGCGSDNVMLPSGECCALEFHIPTGDGEVPGESTTLTIVVRPSRTQAFTRHLFHKCSQSSCGCWKADLEPNRRP